jgi:hypothetical protein
MLLMQNCLYSQKRIYKNAQTMNDSYSSSDEVYNILFPYTADVDIALLQQGRMSEEEPNSSAHHSTHDSTQLFATVGCADPAVSAPPRSSELLQFD